MNLPANIWFVRSNGGSGSYPIRPEGWRVVMMFAGGMAVSAVLAVLIAIFGPFWLWIVVFVLGAALSAWWFIDTARRHTDHTVTIDEYLTGRRKS